MSNKDFDDFWSTNRPWNIYNTNWTKGMKRQIKQLFEDGGPAGVVPSQIAKITKWTTHEAMCLIEYLVSVGAVKRRFNPIRRYAIDPMYRGDVWVIHFS